MWSGAPGGLQMDRHRDEIHNGDLERSGALTWTIFTIILSSVRVCRRPPGKFVIKNGIWTSRSLILHLKLIKTDAERNSEQNGLILASRAPFWI